MQFVKGLFGPGPTIEWYNNTLCKKKGLAVVKVKCLALVKTKGSLGTFKVDCLKVALGALALLATCLIGAPLSFILVGVGSVCLYTSVKRYPAGHAGELKAEASIKIKNAATAAQSAVNNAVNTIQNTSNTFMNAATTAANTVQATASAFRGAADSVKNAADNVTVVIHGLLPTTPQSPRIP